MRLLLDECLPFRLRPLLIGHDVFTVAYVGWKGVKNGQLLGKAAASAFDAFITTDGSIEHQQNLATLPLSVVVLDAASNDPADLTPLVPRLLSALGTLPARTVTHVS